MKATPLCLSLLLATFVVADARGNRDRDNDSSGDSSSSSEGEPIGDWQVSLIQRHLQVSGVFQSYVEAEDSGLSMAPIPEGGSEFELWAMRQTTTGMEEHLIDTETVGAYIPDGELVITTPDPYSGGIPRTRIDQGFTVGYSVNGLILDLDDAPLAARQVLLDHNVSKYEGGYEPENLGAEQDFAQRMIYENGSSEIVFETGNIPGTDPYHDAGVEAFRLYALPDGEVAQTEIAVAKVQVWPMAEGQIVGLDAETDYDTIPEVRIPLNNLYPKSETWAQIYPGTPSLGTEGTPLDSRFVWDSTVPGKTELVLDDLDGIVNSEGQWTLEVLTETPFGVERLIYTQLTKSSTMKIRGSLNSSN